MLFKFLKLFLDNQIVYSNPSAGQSKLIFPAPFRVGVIRENQFTDLDISQLLKN
jgi:hypothetical protein